MRPRLVGVGLISSKFESILKIFDIEEFEGYKFEVRGNGVKGSMAGFGEIKLDPDGSGTRFTFIAEGNVMVLLPESGSVLLKLPVKKLWIRAWRILNSK